LIKQEYSSAMKIAVTGATGFVGSKLVARLADESHDVKVLTRSVEKARKVFAAPQLKDLEYVAYKPTESGDWQAAISGCDGVINLAGEPISERWSAEELLEHPFIQQACEKEQMGPIFRYRLTEEAK